MGSGAALRSFLPQRHHHALLERLLQDSWGEAASVAALRDRLQWVELGAGQTLMRQGDPGDAMYFVVSGRLRVLVAGDDGTPRVVRDLTRGQPIGEIALFSDQPRSATVLAVRDAVLVRLDRKDFHALLDGGAAASLALTRQVIHRLQTEHRPSRPVELPVVAALVAITAGVDGAALARELAVPMARAGRVRVIDGAEAATQLGLPAGSPWPADAATRLSLWLDEIEAAHDFTLLVADGEATPWTRCVLRQCDEVLLLADATQPPALHAIERDGVPAEAEPAAAARVLVLMHPADTRVPRATRRWFEGRALADHVHLRRGHAGDLARLARLQTRTAVGLVLAGGGARGFAHLGVWRALAERGIEVDCVGGTSMGAVIGCLIAADPSYDEALAVTRESFGGKPTSDFNLLPMISLLRGTRMRRLLRHALARLAGPDAGIEDLWKRFFCMASNYTQAREVMLAHGDLERSLRASCAIPGALPPVVQDGELLFDGGTLNNFPVDVMRTQRGIGRVIGVDLHHKNVRPLEFDEVPGPWTLLFDRLRGRAGRRYRMPTLASYLMNVTVLYSQSRGQEYRRLTDVYFNPPLPRVGMMQWDQVDRIVAQGREHALQVLDGQAAAKA